MAEARDLQRRLVDRDPDQRVSPEWVSGCWSTITFSWMNAFIAEGNQLEQARRRGVPQDEVEQQALQEKDLIELRDDDLPSKVAETLKVEWDAETLRVPLWKNRSLRRALRKSFGGVFLVAAFYKFIYDSLQMVGPYVLKHFLHYLSTCEAFLETGKDCDPQEGYQWVAVLFVCAVVQTAVLQQYFHRCIRTGMRMNGAVIALIYRKSLVIHSSGSKSKDGGQQPKPKDQSPQPQVVDRRLSAQPARLDSRMTGAEPEQPERKELTTGEIVNLMSADALRIRDVMTYLQTLWSGPYQIVITLIFLWSVIRWATVAGVTVMLAQIPLVTLVSQRVKIAQRELMKIKDERIKQTNEVFSSIRLLKMYAWEDSFEKRLDAIRERELFFLRKYQRMNILSSSMYQVAPILTGVGSLGMYTWLYGTLNAGIAFSALSLFGVLRFPLFMFPNMITSAVEANVALERIQSFLATEEIKGREAPKLDPATAGRSVVELDHAKFQWPGDPPIPLLSFSQKIIVPAPTPGQERAHLTVVIGAVGVGKSVLLQAILGDLTPVEGSLSVNGTIAYAAQDAWIQNRSVKDNIVFNREFDQDRYDKVVKQCCLLPDLKTLPSGEDTEIGEKGVNLSGGQKQRVNLARAVYAKADLLLLDDPFSACDPEVAQKLCEMVSKDLVKSSSVILGTHYLGAIHRADQVILLERSVAAEGEQGSVEAHVAFCGTKEEYLAKYPDPGKDNMGARDRTLSRDVTEDSSKAEKPAAADKDAGKLVEKEKEQMGSVSWTVYKTYINAAGGPCMAWAVLIGLFFGQTTSTMADAWVSYWSDHSAEDSDPLVSSQSGVQGYAITSLLAFFGTIATGVLFRMVALNAARSFHQQLLTKMLKLPMRFYDTTPLGRVLNRFSQDIYTIDESLVNVLMTYCTVLIRVFTTLVLILYATPWFIVIVVPLLYVYRGFQEYYVPCSRQLKRMESNLKSPIFSHFSETLDGLVSIRAYGQQEIFIAENVDRVHRNQRAYYLNMASNRWLAVRLESLGTIVVAASAWLAVLGRSSIAAGVAGLSITYALGVTQSMNWVVRMTADRETNIVAVERVTEYIQLLEEPKRWVPEKDPDKSWPQEGGIVFQDVQMRYRDGGDLVLDGFSLDVGAGEKIGICGRTGAGKSSVLNVLLRIVEPCGGSTMIDGVDIGPIGLHRLRRSLTVLPQDPVLFSGTLRFNLDPALQKCHSREESSQQDKRVWKALEQAHLSKYVWDLAAAARKEGDTEELTPTKCLDMEVAEKGKNYSTGQRQQMCLARALLRSNKILLLDEATSAVDRETDDLIQSTIRNEFASHTVLCIAHRISTVLHNDRICVVGEKKVLELGSPAELQKSETGVFKRLVDHDKTR